MGMRFSSILTNNEVDFLEKIGIILDTKDLLELSVEQRLIIDDILEDILIRECFDEDYNITAEGIICENILDKLSDI